VERLRDGPGDRATVGDARDERGARLAFTYQGERIEKGVRELAASVGSDVVVPCDVRSDEDLDRTFAAVADGLGGLDLMVHAVAFAQAHDLQGRFIDTAREDFWLSLDISAYSLTAMARRAEPLMIERGGGSIVTMTYLGGERAVPRYNVMGVAKATLDASVRYLAADLGPSNIRVNAVSAGPVRTLAARSIPGYTTMEEIVGERASLPSPSPRPRSTCSGRGTSRARSPTSTPATTPWACRPCGSTSSARRPPGRTRGRRPPGTW
jgi:enoyl-[acyl-carrier protein] reductase I